MKKNKVIVDRKKLSAEEINKHQDFENVLNSSLASSKPFWKKIWFYGPVGIATIGVLFTLGVEVLSPEFEKEEERKVNESVLDIDALEDTECIHKPVKELDVEYKVFDFQNEEGGTFTLESGTKIIIPKNAIEAKKGNLKLKVRELNTESDKFLSGVKMDIGSDEAFESNGMVELLVVDQNGTDCSLNKEKKIDVSLVLKAEPKGFDFWKLNKNSKNWEKYPVTYENSSVKDQISKSQLESELKAVTNELRLIDESLSELSTPSEVDFKLPIQGNQRFDLDFELSHFPELKMVKGMEFEVFTSEKYDKTFTRKKWSKVDLSKEGKNYFVQFESKNESFKIQVRPILKGQDKLNAEEKFKDALIDYQITKKELESKAEKKLKERNLKAKQLEEIISTLKSASLLPEERIVNNVNRANFSISSFGYYNCDKVNRYPKPINKELIFCYDEGQPINVESVYIFDRTNNMRYNYGDSYNHSLNRLGFVKDAENILLVSDEGGNFGYVLRFDDLSIENQVVKLKKVTKNRATIDFFEQILNEVSVEI